MGLVDALPELATVTGLNLLIVGGLIGAHSDWRYWRAETAQ